jgi:integrase
MSKKDSIKRKPWRGADSIRECIKREIKAVSTGWRRCLRAFTVWLSEDRGIALSTIGHRISSTRRFLDALDGSGGVRVLKSLDITDVEDFFIKYAKGHGPAATRAMQAAMRHFLRFSASRGWVKHGLSDSVPSLRSYRQSSVPRGFSNESVRALVAASAKRSFRDHAIVLILAIYGVRRGQICGLRFGDIDWRKKRITFRPHKRGKAVQHELVPAVAAVLATYLQKERPKVDDQAVFLRARKPHLPLGPAAVREVIRRLIRRLDSACCRSGGAHALRHAFATRLLQNGQPLKVIADLLGHRSLDAASIYAKVDHPRLLEVAEEWPEVAS